VTASQASNEYLVAFANSVCERFSSAVVGQPEDQLKNPVENLVRSLGPHLGHAANVVTEATVEGIGLPEVAVEVEGALIRHIELNKPGTGADPTRFSGHNAQQWRKFQELPNLIYTDGNAWALYRSGQRVGGIVDIGGIDQRVGQSNCKATVSELTGHVMRMSYKDQK
jgi:hypothetical protein